MIEIQALKNGAHNNQTINGFIHVPDGWAILPNGMETPNFPFSIITVDETQTSPVVISWTPLPILEPEPPTPAQLREEAYNTQAIIEWGGEMLTVAKATQLWKHYTVEGDNDKIQELVNLITKAKIAIWKQYPDIEGKINETISNDKIASNTYTGTGLYGEANPNSIHPNIQAKILIISQNGQTLLTLSRTEATDEPFTWFASSAKEQCNENGLIYNWIVIS